MRLHRLIAILLLLESRGQLRARDLAEALETSERTIHRDIATLCEAGIPIEAVQGRTGGFRLMEGYTNHLPQVRGDDAICLFLRGIGMNPSEQQEAHADLQTVLGRLESRVPDSYRRDVRAAQRRFHFDPTPWDAKAFPAPRLDILRQGVWQCRKLTFGYKNSLGEWAIRIVRPYGLVVKAMRWYLIAYCETKHSVRSFNVPRIEDPKLLDETFEWPEEFSIEEFWRDGVREWTADAIKQMESGSQADGQ